MDKDAKKRLHTYCKMQKKYTKKLVKAAKDFRPYDWQYFLDVVSIMIDNLYQYYSEGNNVWQIDETRLQSVSELEAVKSKLDQINSLDYSTADISRYEQFKKEHFNTATDEWDSLQSKDTYFRLLEYNETVKTDLLQTVFTDIGNNLQKWWD